MEKEIKTIEWFIKSLGVRLQNSKDMDIYKQLEELQSQIWGIMDVIMENHIEDEE